MSKARTTFCLVGFTIAVLSGCLTGGSSNSDAPEDATFLIGAWATPFDSSDGSVDQEVFDVNGTGKSLFLDYTLTNGQWTLTGTDTTAIESYEVRHGMIHVILKVMDVPTFFEEEVWSKYVLRADTMIWYKGVLLQGGISGSLQGNWNVTSSMKDSSGKPLEYVYAFKSNGVLDVSRSGAVYDSFSYVQAGATIQRRNLWSGRKDTLKYEFDGSYLRVYNPSVTESFHKLK